MNNYEKAFLDLQQKYLKKFDKMPPVFGFSKEGALKHIQEAIETGVEMKGLAEIIEIEK
tara:strand:+ start:20390 stop:20566 length:177 start_codon:yes stop_codon:yes gene_type:complete